MYEILKHAHNFLTSNLIFTHQKLTNTNIFNRVGIELAKHQSESTTGVTETLGALSVDFCSRGHV